MVTPGAGFSPIVTRPVIDTGARGLVSGVWALMMQHDGATKAITQTIEALKSCLKEVIRKSPAPESDLSCSSAALARRLPFHSRVVSGANETEAVALMPR